MRSCRGFEFERVLKPSWQIVCHVNSIPKTGDFQTLDLGSDSVMVLRDRDTRYAPSTTYAAIVARTPV